ncbi:hypothetical protein ACN28S_43110 [Cystobacter fuscus]
MPARERVAAREQGVQLAIVLVDALGQPWGGDHSVAGELLQQAVGALQQLVCPEQRPARARALRREEGSPA